MVGGCNEKIRGKKNCFGGASERSEKQIEYHRPSKGDIRLHLQERLFPPKDSRYHVFDFGSSEVR